MGGMKRLAPMSAAETLLARLDAALPSGERPGDKAGPAANRGAGLAAAAGLHDLLARCRLGWDDLLPPDGRLAKLCGRFGSDYPAEREAAYDHAVRFIVRGGATWSALIRLPEALRRPAAAPANPIPFASVPAPPPPEADWLTTVRRLKARAAWWTTTQSAFLDAAERNLADGGAVGAADAKWLRDLWWEVELNDLDPPEPAS